MAVALATTAREVRESVRVSRLLPKQIITQLIPTSILTGAVRRPGRRLPAAPPTDPYVRN
jgi:hypothetical protein